MADTSNDKPKLSIDEIEANAVALIESDAPIDMKTRAMRNLIVDFRLHVAAYRDANSAILGKIFGGLRHLAKQNESILSAIQSAPVAQPGAPSDAVEEPPAPPMDVAAAPPGVAIPSIPGVPSSAPVPAMSVSTKVVGTQS